MPWRRVGAALCLLVACNAGDAPHASRAGAPPSATRGCPQGTVRATSAVADVCVSLYEAPGFGAAPLLASLDEARALCAERGARLCSEREWEAACRGPEGFLYPYGDVFDPERCAVGVGQPEPVGTRNACWGWGGAYDLSGNVEEWVDNGFAKGGSATSDAFGARCGARARPRGEPARAGVRCCRDPEPEPAAR